MQPLFVSSTDKNNGLRHSYGCPTLTAAYVCNRYLQNHWVTLHWWVCNLKCSPCLLALLTESPSYTILMVVPKYVQPMIVSLTFSITGLQHTYGRATLSGTYVCNLYLQNQSVTLYLWVSNRKWRLFVSCTYKNLGLHQNFGCASLSWAYDCKLYLQNHWFTKLMRVPP